MASPHLSNRGLPLRWLVTAALNLALLTTSPSAVAQEGDEGDANLEAISESLTQPLPLGLWTEVGASAAWIAKDPHAGVNLGIGLESERFALHLSAPLWVRIYDLPPEDAPAPATPARAFCRFVRCVEWTKGDDVDWGALSRILTELRLGDDADMLYLRGGPLHGHLGTGQLINHVWGSPVWDERQAGVYARAKLPWAKTTAEFLAPGVLTAYALSGARLSTRPVMAFTDDGGDGIAGGLLDSLRRLELSLEVTTDLVMPLQNPALAALPPTSTRPLSAAAAEVAWDLFPSAWWIQATPLLSTSGMWGLSKTGRGAAEVGGAIGGGARLRFSFPYVAALVEGVGGIQTSAHRASVFGGLYLVERRQLLAPSTTTPIGIGNAPAPGGAYGRFFGEVMVADFVRLGARLQLEELAGANVAEAWADVALWTFRGGARVIRRGLSFDRGASETVFGGTTLLALEARWAFWGPFAARARVQRLPRNVGRVLSIDDDIIVGVEAAFVFGLQRNVLNWF